MIVTKRNANWINLILRLHGTVLPQIRYRLLSVVVIATIVTGVHEHSFESNPWISTAPFSLIGLAISIFLGFRNNTSYDRFWEGRKLWGGVVNTARTLTRRIQTLIQFEDTTTDGRQLILQIAAYVHLLRMHLRDEWNPAEIKHLIPADVIDKLVEEKNRPVALLHWLGVDFSKLYKSKQIHPQHLPLLEESLESFTNLQGGCERIKTTPIPFSYNVLIHRIVAVYCFGLPFGLVSITGWLTPLVTALVAYAFLGIDAIGEEIEEPFGKDDNDLPLEAISTMIEINVRQRLGDTELPNFKVPDTSTGALF